MCGIAGFSLSSDSPVDRTLAAQALLAGIAERGADAVGYAHRGGDGSVGVTKLRGGASALLDELDVPAATSQALIHVRDYTKGHPEIQANNHPIRHGSVVGIHNGVIENDDALLARYGLERAEPQMTVDSEAIFALMEHRRHDPRALSEMRGAMAAAWLDERDESTLYLARGRLRPLWLGRTNDGLYFASTRRALTIAAAALRTRLDIREVREGRLLHVVEGRVVRERRFRPDRQLPRGRLPAARPRTARGRVVPRAARGAGVNQPPRSDPSGSTSTPSSRSRSRTRYWNAVHAPRGTSSSRYTCHSDSSVESARRASAQSDIFGRRPSVTRERSSLRDGSLEALLALEHLEARLRGAHSRASRRCARTATPTGSTSGARRGRARSASAPAPRRVRGAARAARRE